MTPRRLPVFAHRLALLLIAVQCSAQTLLVPQKVLLDDFESYPSTNALVAVWTNFVGNGTIGLETNIIYEGTKALRLKYSVGSSPNTNTVIYRFPSPQNWSTNNSIWFSHGGAVGNSTDNLIVQIFDHLDGLLGSYVISGGTVTSPYANVRVDLGYRPAFTNAIHQTDLSDVQAIALGVVAGTSRGSGTVYFDNLVVGNNGNLVGNPGFRDLDNSGSFGDGWNSFGVQQFQNFLPNGNPGHATFYSDINGNTGAVIYPASPVIPGAKYRLSVDINCESLWHATTTFGVQFVGDDNTTVLTQRVVNMYRFIDAPHSYKTASMFTTAPTGVSGIRPWIAYSDSWRQSGGSQQRAVLDNVVLAVETNRVLSIFGASIHQGLTTSAVGIHYMINGSYAHSFGALLTSTMATNGWRVANQSIPGDTTTSLRARFYTDESPLGADIAFIGLSMGNEGLPGSTNPIIIYDKFYNGITNLIAMTRSNNTLPLVGCGFPRDAYTSNEIVWLKKMDLALNTLDVPTINFFGATDNGIGKMLPLLSSGDGIHFNDAGHYELYLCFVPSVFDALMAGKKTPRWSDNRRFAQVTGDPLQPAPLTFSPPTAVHSFSFSFRVRSAGAGTIASISLPGTNATPTVEIQPTGFVYNSSGGQSIASTVSPADGNWHEVLVAHQYSRTQTWLYVDSILAGNVTERLTPIGFVLGGPGNATNSPPSPPLADYENWFIHRSAMTVEQITAHFQGRATAGQHGNLFSFGR
jgi:lysophospholipase L1-like esterase